MYRKGYASFNSITIAMFIISHMDKNPFTANNHTIETVIGTHIFINVVQ
jgi:hypothetical protein